MASTINNKALQFDLPKTLESAKPTEERGLPRDGVRLLVSDRTNNKITHTKFNNITRHLQAGDVLVVNTSGTLPAALPIQLPNDNEGRLHLSTKLSDKEWLVEIREVMGSKTERTSLNFEDSILYFPNLPAQPWPHGQAGGGKVIIESNYYNEPSNGNHLRLWKAIFDLPVSVESYLATFGRAIKYLNVHEHYPIEYYQTVFANEMGSSEMPSAGRAFTKGLLLDLVLKGVQIAPVVLHTGVSSLEAHEKPYPEYFKVPAFTASTVNRAKEEGRRIVAIGTTSIRAIESAVNTKGRVVATEGMTDLFITPDRGLKVVNSMLTGFHEPQASHLLMMEALADREHLAMSYTAAIEQGYQWHEFGDLHLIL